jgi:hypothetical protein
MCFIFLVAVMGGLVALSVWLGEFGRLNHGYDYEGHLCGVDADVKDKPFVFYCGSKEVRADKYPEHLYHRARSCIATCPTDFVTEVGCLRPETFQFHEAKGANAAVANGVDYELTYEIEVHQTVEQGKSYPTNAVGGFCIPQDETLKLGLLENQNANPKITWFRTMRSIVVAGPVVLGAAILALLLGTLYLHLLSKFAGPLIFGSLVLSTFITSIIGLFFLIAIFFNPEEYNNAYCNMNPILHTVQSSTGTFYSVLLGVVMLGFGGCLFISTKNALGKIDESIGVIAPALDCVFSNCDMSSLPFKFFLVMFLEISVLVAGLAILTTVGYINHTSIEFNAKYVTGLEAKFVWYDYWEIPMCFYVLMSWWIFETSIAAYQFTVSYAVCQWYWVKPTYDQQDLTSKKVSATPKFINATVAGVDAVGGQRKGVRVKSAGGNEVVVFPVGKRGPGQRDVLAGMNLNDVVFRGDDKETKKMPDSAVNSGANKALYYHLGTLAKGAPIIAFCRVFRLISMAIRATCGRADKRTSYDDEDQTPGGAAIQLTQLLAGLIENICGGLSKNAFVDVVLSTNNFKEASVQSKWMVEDAGGVVAFMHGSCVLYEIIGVTLITAICSVTTNIVLTYVGLFSVEDSQWFVQDSWDVTIFACFLCGLIAYSFMAQFNITIDAILYQFAWARRMKLVSQNEAVLPRAIKGILEKELMADPDSMGVLEPQGNRMNPFGGAHFGHAVSKLTSTALGSRREGRPLLTGGTNFWNTGAP